MTSETDTAVVLRELKRLDPSFSLEVWRENMRDLHVPKLLSAWLRGDKEVGPPSLLSPPPPRLCLGGVPRAVAVRAERSRGRRL